MRYTARFNGRFKGAIGIFHNHVAEVEGENEEQARINLYNTHDHITRWFSRRLFTMPIESRSRTETRLKQK